MRSSVARELTPNTGPYRSGEGRRDRTRWRVFEVVLVALLSLVGPAQGQFRSPSIIEHPADVLVGRDEPATLNCHADGRPEPSITWYKDGRPLQPSSAGGRHLVLDSGDLFFLQVRQDDTTDDAGTYWCVATNTVASARSHNATLEIAVLGTVFAAVPRNSRVAEGEVAMLECRPPAGSPTPVVTWLRDGMQLDPSVNHRYRVSPSGELVITSARVGDSGHYTCLARNAFATRTAPPATLTVLVKPHLVSSSGSVTAPTGATVELVCRVGGDPAPEVFWGRVTPKGMQLPLERLVQEERGQVLRLRHVSLDDQGVYSCTAENPVGFVAANTSLTVHSRPVFTSKPKDARVGVDGTARFECLVSGSPEPSTYWTHEGSGLLVSVGQAWAGGRVRVGGDNSLSIGGVREEDTGYYACVAVGEAGSAIARAYLEVQGVSDMPPPIIAVGATNQTLPLHTEAELPCEARGTPEPTVTWRKDGRLLDTFSSARHSVTPLGTLRITELQHSDSGLYTCSATNIAGSSQWQAALAVHKATNPNIRFVKMFWHSDLPEPPQNLIVLAVNETQVTLGWSRGRSGSSSIRGHSVQYWSPDLRGPWRDGATVAPTQHIPTPWATTVTNLVPNTRYVFTVRSRNKDFVSRPSVFTHFIRTLNSGGQDPGTDKGETNPSLRDVRSKMSSPTVRLVSVEAVSSTSLKVFWRLLVNDPNSLEGLYVRYRPIDPRTKLPVGVLSVETVNFPIRGDQLSPDIRSSSGEDQSSKVSTPRSSAATILHPTGAPTTYTITNLRPGTDYQVFVVPFYRSIEGQPTSSMRRSTLPAPLLVIPTGLHYRVVNESVVKVEWDPLPSTVDIGGRLRGYNLQIVNITESRSPLVYNITTNATFVLTPHFASGSTYEMTVRGVTDIGLGPPSNGLRYTQTRESIATKTVTNSNLGPSITGDSNTYIIIAIVCAAILVFGFLLAAVVWIYRKRNLNKCPHYFSKGDGGSGPWSAYSGCWEDGNNANRMSSSRCNDGAISAMNNIRYTDCDGTLTVLNNLRYTENGDTGTGMTTSLYSDAGGQFYAATEGKGGYQARPAEDMMYEDPEGLRLVSFKGRHNHRCASPEPYATTPLITVGGQADYPHSIKGNNTSSDMRQARNTTHMPALEQAQNFNARSQNGSLLTAPVLQFPPPPPPPLLNGVEGGSTTGSSISHGSHSNPSRVNSSQHLLLQHLPYPPSRGSNQLTGGSNSSHHTTGGSSSSHHTSPMLHPRSYRSQVSPNPINSVDPFHPSHHSNPVVAACIISNHPKHPAGHSNNYSNPGQTSGQYRPVRPFEPRNNPVTVRGTDRGGQSWIGNGVGLVNENGMMGYLMSPGGRCSSPQSSALGDESDFNKEDDSVDSCWSGGTTDEREGSTSGGSLSSLQPPELNWSEAVRRMSAGNWPADGSNNASIKGVQTPPDGFGPIVADHQNGDRKIKVSAANQSDEVSRATDEGDEESDLYDVGISNADVISSQSMDNVNDKYFYCKT